MNLGENVRKISAVAGILRAINGQKTTIATVVSIVSFAWSIFLPGTAPTEGQVMDVFTQGKEIGQTATETVWPAVQILAAQVVTLLSMIAAFVFNLHSKSKFALAMSALCQLANRYLSLDDLHDPQLVDRLKNNLPKLESPSTVTVAPLPIKATPIQSVVASSPPTEAPKAAEAPKP